MRDMDVLRPQLARNRLSHRTQAKLRAGECCIAGAATERGGRPGKENVALPARHHQPCRLTAGEETGIARHLPDLAEDAFGGVENREIDVGADIEDAYFHR